MDTQDAPQVAPQVELTPEEEARLMQLRQQAAVLEGPDYLVPEITKGGETREQVEARRMAAMREVWDRKRVAREAKLKLTFEEKEKRRKERERKRLQVAGKPSLFGKFGKPTTEKMMEVKASQELLPGAQPLPPDDAPSTSHLAKSGPPDTHLKAMESEFALDQAIENPEEVRHVEQRIGLLSRYVMLAALWEKEGWSKKDRFDAAARAINVIEGSKSTIWQPEVGGKRDWTADQYNKERGEAEMRLHTLMARRKAGRDVSPAELVKAATDVNDPIGEA